MKKRIITILTLSMLCILFSVQVVQAATLLKFGSTGQDVISLQKNLQKLGYDVGPIDGIFGLKTKTGVQAFQQEASLTSDGIVGPLTSQAITAALAQYERNQKTQAIITTAKELSGVPYKWGGTTTSGFDCSGYTQYVFAKNGIAIPRSSKEQYQLGQSIEFNSLMPGDLVFFNFVTGAQVSHVGIYLGNGQFISATTSKGVTIYGFTPYWTNAYIGAKRVY